MADPRDAAGQEAPVEGYLERYRGESSGRVKRISSSGAWVEKLVAWGVTTITSPAILPSSAT